MFSKEPHGLICGTFRAAFLIIMRRDTQIEVWLRMSVSTFLIIYTQFIANRVQ